MVKDVDELVKRLEDDTATFTALEVRTLLDWTFERVSKDAYNQSRIATALQQAQELQEFNQRIITELLDKWESTPTTPTLQVVSYDQA